MGFSRFNSLGLKCYQNDEYVVITSLKVATRFCDDYFYNNNLSEVIDIAHRNGKFYAIKNGEDYHHYDERNKPSDFLHDIVEGKEKRKIIFLYRQPLERYIATLNHFFVDFLEAIMFDFEKYPLKQYMIHYPNIKNNKGIGDMIRNRLRIPKYVKDSVTKEMFETIINSDIDLSRIRQKLDSKSKERNKQNLKLKKSEISVLHEMASIFLNYESEQVFEDQHYSSYIKSYNLIINDKNCENISLVDIDNINLMTVLNIKTTLKNKRGVEYDRVASDTKSNTTLKKIIRKAIEEPYKLKKEILKKWDDERKELTQLKIWKI